MTVKHLYFFPRPGGTRHQSDASGGAFSVFPIFNHPDRTSRRAAAPPPPAAAAAYCDRNAARVGVGLV